MILSVILPSFNVGKYIDDCLRTIYTQNLPESEYEVICVNDCSTDNTAEIIKSYKKKHGNLILLEHEVNKNLGASRNTGLKIAKGKYIWFIDPDDFIVENCFQKIINVLEENNLEVLEINSYLTDPSKSPTFLEVNFQQDTDIQTGTEYLYSLMNFRWGRVLEVWRRIYRKDFLENNNLVFSEYLFGIEDLVMFYQSMLVCKKYKHISDYCYYYRIDNSESMTNNRKSIGMKLAVKIAANIEVIKIFEKDKTINSIEFKKKAAETYHWSIRKCYKKIYSLDNNNLNEYLKKINPYKQLINEFGTKTEIILTTNTLFVKSINAIFAPFIKLRKFLKSN